MLVHAPLLLVGGHVCSRAEGGGGDEWCGCSSRLVFKRSLCPCAVVSAYHQGVIANAKHYINNNQETNRGTVSANLDERTEHEVRLGDCVCV
jgi:beta-glucosidase